VTGATAYRVPVVAGSDLDDLRLAHLDLADLDGLALAVERWRVLRALADDHHPRHERPWLVERSAAIAAERARRYRRARG